MTQKCKPQIHRMELMDGTVVMEDAVPLSLVHQKSEVPSVHRHGVEVEEKAHGLGGPGG